MYQEQKGGVRWGQVKSEQFTITNGTRQGSVMSPILWAVYCDPMIKRLRKLGLGAHVAGLFMGVACFTRVCQIDKMCPNFYSKFLIW